LTVVRGLAYDSGMALERSPETDRPRERLYWNGPEALADAELLAIQLGSGVRGKSASGPPRPRGWSRRSS
jgi:hypothetical protein